LDEDFSAVQFAIGNQEDLNLETTEADKQRYLEQALDVQETSTMNDDELQKELKRFLIPKLRSASYRWAERSKAIKNARVSRGLYSCASCGDENVKNGDFAVDHTEPVVPLDGWDGKDWTQYVTRMFVKAEQFQILCHPCHDIKSNLEVQLRKLRREAKKKLDK
jgi:5-methylcytosine-specific restriction endonuclease McrA